MDGTAFKKMVYEPYGVLIRCVNLWSDNAVLKPHRIDWIVCSRQIPQAESHTAQERMSPIFR